MRKSFCKNCRRFKRLCECGRCETITPEIEAKLEEGLQLGMPITKAVEYARVSRDAYYRKVNSDVPFRNKMTAARYHLSVLARKSLMVGIAKNPSLALAYLERKEPDEFSTKQTRVNEGAIRINLSEEARKRLGKYRQQPDSYG